jgi:serine phosphatase RsbU (regulator of sigma subunit)
LAAVPPLDLLLVEDDDGDALLFEELVRESDLDVDVRRVRTAAAALEVVGPETSCVVLDLGLPDAEGLEIVRRLRDSVPHVAVLVLTGLFDTARGLEAVAAGAQDYLVKGRVDGDTLARAIRYSVERHRAEQTLAELRVAQATARESSRLERGLLPRPLLADPRVAVGSGYRPGRERSLLGGDFFDVVEVADGTVHAVIGDVCGHDPDAAALGVALRIAWRTLVLGGRARGDALLDTLEEVLVHERLSPEVYATVCMASVAPDRESLDLEVAGHPLPILLGPPAATLRVETVRPPLGTGLPARSKAPVTVTLPPAARILLYTDGLIEGRAGPGADRLGIPRLLEMLDGPHAQAAGDDGDALIAWLLEATHELNGGAVTDDVAAVMLAFGRDG